VSSVAQYKQGDVGPQSVAPMKAAPLGGVPEAASTYRDHAWPDFDFIFRLVKYSFRSLVLGTHSVVLPIALFVQSVAGWAYTLFRAPNHAGRTAFVRY